MNTMVSFATALQKTNTKALVDSGATENFISPTLLKRLGIKTRKLQNPIAIKTVDGSGHKDGKIYDYCWITVNLGTKKATLPFLVA